MTIAKPQNRDEFKENVLIRLGKPVIEVNISDEQLDICIEEAFQYFHERSHYDGNERVYISVDTNNSNVRTNFSSFEYTQSTNLELNQATGRDFTTTTRRQNNFIILPDDVTGVTEILRPSSGMGLGGGIFPPGFGFPGLIGSLTGNQCDTNGFGLIQYWAFQEYLALINFIRYPPKMYRFNPLTHRLMIDGNIDGMLVLQCMVKPNPDLFPDVWNDGWLKMYATALAKQAWGMNLTKYTGVQLPGGITLNGERILTDAQNELTTIRQRFAMDVQDPPLDMVG